MITNKEKSFISVVAYLHNDEQFAGYFIKQMSKFLNDNFEKYEIICVNDACTDNTSKIVREAARRLDGVPLTIVNLSYYQGLEAAMNAGVDIAIGDFIFEFDSVVMDYNVKFIKEVFARVLKGNDIVAVRNQSSSGFASRLFYKLYNKSSNTHYDLGTETFRILSRRAINRIYSMSKTVPYRKALYANCGLKMDAMFYKPLKDVKIKRSAQQLKHRRDTAVNTLILFTDVGYKAAMYAALFMMSLTFLGVVYTIIIYALKQPIAGYTTTMLVLTGSFFGVFALLAVIIRYLSVILDLVFLKQRYIIESVENIRK